VRREPGGGGVNVARVIHALDGPVCAWVALGGGAGAQHRALLAGQGVDLRVFDLPDETRQSWAITDESGAQYRLQLPGEPWPEDACARALADMVASAQGLVVLSGSQPPRLSASFARSLAAELGPSRLIVDTSGLALQDLLEHPGAGLLLLRLDQAEAEAQAGRPLADLRDTARFAAEMRARDVAELVAIARGADGNVLASTEGCHLSRPPRVEVRSKVGAGDSFTGAFALALARGAPPTEALALGTAAAAATVSSEGTALCTRAAVESLRPECEVIALDR